MLDVKGGETDRTAFFSIEVTSFFFFFYSTVLKHSANFGQDPLRDLVHMLTTL